MFKYALTALATVGLCVVSTAHAQYSVFVDRSIAYNSIVDKIVDPLDADSFVITYWSAPLLNRGTRTIIASYPVFGDPSTGIVVEHVQVGDSSSRVSVFAQDITKTSYLKAVSSAPLYKDGWNFVEVAIDLIRGRAHFQITGVDPNTGKAVLNSGLFGVGPDNSLSYAISTPFAVPWKFSAWSVAGRDYYDTTSGHNYRDYYSGLLYNLIVHAHNPHDATNPNDYDAVTTVGGVYRGAANLYLDINEIVPLNPGRLCSSVFKPPSPLPTICMLADVPAPVASFLDNATQGSNPFTDVHNNIQPRFVHP